MSEQTVDTAFLKGKTNEELKALIAGNDPRLKQVLADPELKKAFYKGELTKADPAPQAVPAAPATPATVEEPIHKKLGFDTQEALLKDIEDQKAYRKNLETRLNEMHARAGAEGGPLGQKVKTHEEEIARLKSELAEAKRRPDPVQPDLSPREILDLYEPDLADNFDPANFADPEAAKIVKKQQAEMKKFVSSLKGQIGKLSPANVQKQLAEVIKRNEELQGRMDLLIQKDEQREATMHTEQSQNSFNAIYDEADAFIRSIGIKPSRHFSEIDRAIAASGEAGSESRRLFLAALPETDRKAWDIAMPIIQSYGEVVYDPINGGRANVARFEKYRNVKLNNWSLNDLYNQELLRSGQLDAKKRQEILDALRLGAQSVIQSTVIPPGVKGLPDAAAAGETLPVETTLEEKQKRIKELVSNQPRLLKDPALMAEYKKLSAEVKAMVKTQLAQGNFKRKK